MCTSAPVGSLYSSQHHQNVRSSCRRTLLNSFIIKHNMYYTRDSRVSGLCPSSSVLSEQNVRKQDMSVLRWRVGRHLLGWVVRTGQSQSLDNSKSVNCIYIGTWEVRLSPGDKFAMEIVDIRIKT
jgi:hypothetical protein